MSINPFHLSDYKYLFFDMFYKNNKLYLISPIYNQPFNSDDIHIKINNKRLNLTSKHIKDCNEPIAIYIYNVALPNAEPNAEPNAAPNAAPNATTINVIVTFYNITKTFVLTHHKTQHSDALAITTLFKDDYALFPLFYDYYKKQGVSHFYMYYNGISSPIIKQLFKHANVTLIDWNFTYWTPKNKYTHHAQPGQMHHALYRYGKDAGKYMIFCDFDEYLYIPHTTLKTHISQHPSVDTFGFCNKWSKTLDNSKINTFPKQFLTTPGIYPYNTRSKNIHKVNTINTIGVHVAFKYSVKKPLIISKYIMFHFYNWSKPNRENKDCPMSLVTLA